MTVTIRDICREAGVSVATVSRIINGSPRVAKETKRTVLAAIRKLGYTPNAAARNLAAKTAGAIGAIFHQMTSGFYASVMSGIELEARARGLQILITIAHHVDPQRTHYHQMLAEARVDGLIVVDSTMDKRTLAKLKSYRRPIVAIQSEVRDRSVASVSAANREGARMALNHLLGLGYRDILLIAGPPEAQDSNLRMEGCREALAEHGLSLDNVAVITGRYSEHEAQEAFKAYRAKKGLPRAIFSFNDDMALSVMRELRLTNVAVPGQVAIVGFDGVEAADYMGLTTIAIPMIDLGQQAVKLLVEKIQNPEAPTEHVVKACTLVIRQSCGGIPSGQP